MRSLWHFYSLGMRPKLLLMAAYLLAMATFLPAMVLPDTAPPILEMWRGGALPLILAKMLWRETIIVPLFTGGLIGVMTVEVRAMFVSWQLPSLRRDLAFGTLQMLALITIVGATVHWGYRSNPVAGGVVAAASFMCGARATGGTGSRSVLALMIALLALAIRPEIALELAGVSPIIVGVAGATAIVWFARALMSPALHRAQSLRNYTVDEPGYWKLYPRFRGNTAPVPLGDGSAFTWYRMTLAAVDSTILTRMGSLIITALIPAVIAYAENDTLIVSILIFSATVAPALSGISGMFPYPLSRMRRANLRFLAVELTSLQYIVVTGLLITALFAWRPFPQFMSLQEGPMRHAILPSVAAVMLWMPLAQWGAAQPSYDTLLAAQPLKRFEPRMFIGLTAFILLQLLSLKWYERRAHNFSTMQIITGFGIGFVIVHGLFLLLLRRAYRRKDLI